MKFDNVELEVSKCFESPTNPRGNAFEAAPFAELVASIKQSGVLMPVLARPSKGGKYEIVAGNRRLRAAKKVGLAWIPARVVALTDDEAREAQIVENLQRADINPIEEAHAYQDYLKKSNLEVAAIAAKVGKSESYIRLRIGLLGLEKEYADMVRDGSLPVAHAQLIARLDKEDQREAFEVATGHYGEVGFIAPLSDLREHVQKIALKNAMKSPPWKDDEAMKAEIATATGITGGGKTLFGDKAADSFDDPAQYARALAAFFKITQDKYAADGKKLSLIRTDYGVAEKGSGVLPRGRYSLVSDVKGCRSGHDALVVEGDNAGKIIRICTDKECAAHHPKAKEQAAERKEESAAAKKKREEAEKRAAAEIAKKNKKFVAAIERVKAPLSDAQIDVLFDRAMGNNYSVSQIGKIFGLSPKVTKRSWGDEESYSDAVLAHFGSTKTGKLQFIVATTVHDWNEARQNKDLKRL